MADKLSRRQALMLGGGALAGAATFGAGVQPAAAATGWTPLPVITANIGRQHPEFREAAINAVRHGAEHRPLVGWQEIREGDKGEPAMIRRHFGEKYTNVFLDRPGSHPRSHRVPISVPRPWQVVSRNATFVHDWVYGPNGKPVSPPRYLNEVVVAHQSDPNLTFVLINTHYISKAYTRDDPRYQDEWNLHKKTHRERVMAYHDLGYLVIWTADTNRPDYDRATDQNDEHKAFGHGIDRINWLPGNGSVRLDLVGTKEIPMNVDSHNARLANFRIRVR